MMQLEQDLTREGYQIACLNESYSKGWLDPMHPNEVYYHSRQRNLEGGDPDWKQKCEAYCDPEDQMYCCGEDNLGKFSIEHLLVICSTIGGYYITEIEGRLVNFPDEPWLIM